MADEDIHTRSARGTFFFRPAEAADYLGVGREVIDAATDEWTASRGRSGLAWAQIGRGRMVRREAIDTWMIRLEQTAAGR